jgi:hypothetical protein
VGPPGEMSGVCPSVGVKLRRRALVLPPQDGEQQLRQGVKATKIITFVFHRRLLRDLRSVDFEHACKEPASALCSSGGGRSQAGLWASRNWRCDIVVRVGGWDRRVLDAGGEIERCHGDEVVNYYYHSITHHGVFVGCLCVLAYVGIMSLSGT